MKTIIAMVIFSMLAVATPTSAGGCDDTQAAAEASRVYSQMPEIRQYALSIRRYATTSMWRIAVCSEIDQKGRINATLFAALLREVDAPSDICTLASSTHPPVSCPVFVVRLFDAADAELENNWIESTKKK